MTTQVHPAQRLFSVILLAIVIFSVYRYPLGPAWLAVGLILYGLLLWRHSAAWLVLVPALLPILDLTFWSGRLFFGEFDIVILLTVAIACWRAPLATGQQTLFPKAAWVIGTIALVQFLSTAIGLVPLAPLDANAFSNYYSPYNSLRVSKGFWLALLLLPLLRQELRRGAPVGRLFSIGMVTGLAGTALVIAWERVIFPGAFDFDSDYRVTALFSGMHTGGAAVDCYLSAALPFAMACFLLWRGIVVKFAGIGLFAASLYALLVTFSRVDYLAFCLTGLALFSGLLFLGTGIRHAGRLVITMGVVLVATVLIALPVLTGSYIQQRFALTSEDMEARLKHWQTALSMRNDGWMTALFGMGKGSFPRTYFWRNNENVTPATYQYLNEDGEPFLRLTSGASLYMGQRIWLPGGDPYVLEMDLRCNVENGSLAVAICEKAVLYSFGEAGISIKTDAAPGQWKHYRTSVELGKLGRGPWYSRRPVELGLFDGQNGLVVDVKNVQLTAPDGQNLITNGDFGAGQDRWFFSADNHLPWHVKNLWVEVLFEEGWVGLGIFVVLPVYLFCILLKRIRAGDRLALLLMASLVGFLAVGLADSVFDEPRMALLFFFMVWLSMIKPPQPENRVLPGLSEVPRPGVAHL
jgi:hypothetical protein